MLGTLIQTVLIQGHTVRFRARGHSMLPFVRSGRFLHIVPNCKVRMGDVVLYVTDKHHVIVHRVVARLRDRETGKVFFVVQGDNCLEPDGLIGPDRILGRVKLVERGDGTIRLDSQLSRLLGLIWHHLFPVVRIRCLRLGRLGRMFGLRT